MIADALSSQVCEQKMVPTGPSCVKGPRLEESAPPAWGRRIRRANFTAQQFISTAYVENMFSIFTLKLFSLGVLLECTWYSTTRGSSDYLSMEMPLAFWYL